MMKQLYQYLCEPTDGASVAFIRVSFGAVMVYWLIMHIVLDKITHNYYEPSFLFPYTGFEWVQVWPGRGLHLHFLITLIAALGVTFGVFYRVCSVVFAIGITYIFLLDKATYQNHYYFISLLSILMVVCPVERVLSFDAIRRNLKSTIPRWVLLLFQFQIGLVYFFGGVAKINYDWLHGFPMREVLSNKQDHALIGAFCGEEWFVMFFVWSGMLFDLLIVPMLMWRKTRAIGFLASLTFHLLNASLFRIGIFPWAMIFLTTIFFAPDWPRRFLSWMFQTSCGEKAVAEFGTASSSVVRKIQMSFVGVFVFLQIALPLRHYFVDENTSWTERNHHFSWHMKLRGKTTAVRFYVVDEKTMQADLFDLKPHMKLHQLMRMSRDPWMIRDFAGFIEEEYREKGFENVAVRVFALSSLNGRTPQLLIDPSVDLTQKDLPKDWIVPLEEPVGGDFYEPITEWERIVMKDPIRKELVAARTSQ